MDSLALYTMAQAAQVATPVTTTPASTSSAGTMTSGTTETMDAVLGTYQCNLISGRRYLAVMNNLMGGATVAGDLYEVKIRNSGSSSTPTTSSTLIAFSQWYCPAAGGVGQTTIPLACSFIAPANGVNTFAFFAVRAAGTGVFTPLSGSASRELYVMYLGAV